MIANNQQGSYFTTKGRGRGRGNYIYSGNRGPTEPSPGVSHKSHKISGTCLQMCPDKERQLREREGLLHRFEVYEEHTQKLESSWPTESPVNVGNNGRSGGRRCLPKADVKNTIKSFARSAAGQDKTVPEDLRPASVLKDTVKYLCTRILTRDCQYNVIYDFMFDRLRAVRQDLVVQRIENEDAILILETIIRFHVYSGFKLRDEPISVYDPHINQKHLVDCLRKLLTLYDYNKYTGHSREEFLALNCLVSIGSYDIVSKAIAASKEMLLPCLETAVRIALAYQSRNFVQFFQNLVFLPCILQMYCIRHVPVMRSLAFQVFCIAHGVNSCKIPLTWLATQLMYPTVFSLHKDLGEHLGIQILRDKETNEKYAKFAKHERSVIAENTAKINCDFSSPPISTITQDILKISISKLCLSF